MILPLKFQMKKIISMIQANPNITAEEMAEKKLFMTVNRVKYYIKKVEERRKIDKSWLYKEGVLES